jgi:hypothetical protein
MYYIQYNTVYNTKSGAAGKKKVEKVDEALPCLRASQVYSNPIHPFSLENTLPKLHTRMHSSLPATTVFQQTHNQVEARTSFTSRIANTSDNWCPSEVKKNANLYYVMTTLKPRELHSL